MNKYQQISTEGPATSSLPGKLSFEKRRIQSMRRFAAFDKSPRFAVITTLARAKN